MAVNRQKPRAHRELLALRINAGLSRRDVSRRAGISTEAIRLAELGFLPSVRVQFALASEFDLRPLDLWPMERQKITPRQKAAA